MDRVVVVSNRVASAQGASGGLAVAIEAALRGQPALWFGWSGERTACFDGTLGVRRQGELEIVTLDLEDADYDEYYNGYANAALWPLFHSRTDLAEYNRSFSQGYARVNARFAAALAPLLRPDDLVWVHDYHLIPLGRELRGLGFAGPIGFFLHIPWPAAQLFVTLPHHRDLVSSMFAYDLVGMQTEDDVAAFRAYVLGEAGGVAEGGRLRAFGHSLTARAFPVGLDTADFQALAASEPAERTCDRMMAHGAFRSLMVGVDRLDYAKGLPERLLAFEHYLQTHPDMVRKVLYLQIAPSSREGVEAYQALRANVLALAGRINAQWAEMDHAPVLYVNRNLSRAELAGVYRAARVGLVTPLRDGMNLVAKEYVAAQSPDDPGVLVLSRFAGAAAQMKDALIVNPYAREELAEALDEAVRMERPERVRRWSALMNGVARDDVHAWRDDFIAALMEARRPDGPAAELPRPARLTLEPDEGLLPPAAQQIDADRRTSAPGWRPKAPG